MFGNAREFVLGLDKVHLSLTKSLENARPPRFDYEEVGEQKIIVTYRSQRNLIDIYIGLARVASSGR